MTEVPSVSLSDITWTTPVLWTRKRSAPLVSNVVFPASLFCMPSVVPSENIWCPSVEALPVVLFFSTILAWPEPPFISKTFPDAPDGLVVPTPKFPDESTVALVDPPVFILTVSDPKLSPVSVSAPVIAGLAAVFVPFIFVVIIKLLCKYYQNW